MGMSWDDSNDVVRVASEQLPGVKEAIWLYAPFVMTTLLNVQYLIWSGCTSGRTWKQHTHAAFSKAFFLLLANVWLTHLLHGGLVLVANIHAYKPTADHVIPLLPNHHFDNTSADATLKPGDRWGLVLRLGVPLTVATHALSNLAAVALTMSAESTLIASSACTSCDVTLATSFRSRILLIIGALWALDLLLIFYPLMTHSVHEMLFQTILYSWLAYVSVMAEVWIFVLCGLAYYRALKMYREDPDYCPRTVLVSIRHKILVIVPMTLIVFVTLLPWPLCEIIYTDRKLYNLIMPYLKSYLSKMDTKAAYDYICALPYVHFLIQSILVIAFGETRWRLCSGQRKAMMEAAAQDDPADQSEDSIDNAGLETSENNTKAEVVVNGEEYKLKMGDSLSRGQQRTSFLQGSLFAENIETLRVHLQPTRGGSSRAEDPAHLYFNTDYNTLTKETTV